MYTVEQLCELDIVYVLSKFMNFWVAQVYGNNGMFYGDTKI